MIIVTVHPLADEEKVQAIKKQVMDTFLKFGNLTDKFDFNVRSVFWQVNENASSSVVFEHIGGAPFVYESLLNTKFRVSAYTFFQTNSTGAAKLYTVIGDFLDLPNVDQANTMVNAELRDKVSYLKFFLLSTFIKFRKKRIFRSQSTCWTFVVEPERLVNACCDVLSVPNKPDNLTGRMRVLESN